MQVTEQQVKAQVEVEAVAGSCMGAMFLLSALNSFKKAADEGVGVVDLVTSDQFRGAVNAGIPILTALIEATRPVQEERMSQDAAPIMSVEESAAAAAKLKDALFARIAASVD